MGLFAFGKEKEPKVDGSQRIIQAIQKMDETITMLEKKKANYDKRRLEVMRKAKGQKRREDKIRSVKSAKLLKVQIDRLQGQMDNLETQRFSLENAQQMRMVIETMESGQQALKHVGLDLEDLEERMDDIRENMAQLEEINDTLSQPMVDMGYDDEELLDEFEAEMAELEEDEADSILDGLNLDSVPTEEPELDDAVEDEEPVVSKPAKTPKKKREDQEMADLLAWG